MKMDDLLRVYILIRAREKEKRKRHQIWKSGVGREGGGEPT